MKKLTAILLAALMIASAMPMSVFAAEAPETEAPVLSVKEKQTDTTAPVKEESEAETTAPEKEAEKSIGANSDPEPLGASSFTYTVSNNQVTITGLIDNTVTDLVIPDTIENLPVVAIKAGAFNDCSQITSIIVPNSVTSIGEGAFKGTSPTKVTLPFVGASRTANDYTGRFGIIFGYIESRSVSSSYTDSIAPEGTTYQNYVTGGGTYKYYYCYYIPRTIKEVDITDATSIPYSAFYNCSWIENITVNQAVESIGSYAFYNCSALTSFETPDSVTSIGESAFENCSSLTMVNLPNSISVINSSLFSKCTSLKSVNFPRELNIIKNLAFSDCSSLQMQNLMIPEGVTEIGDSAFSGCSKITSITVPNSVTSIGDGAFKGTSPTKVTLPFVGASRTANDYTGRFGIIFGYIESRSVSSSYTDSIAPEGTTYQNYVTGGGMYKYYYCYYIPRTIKEVDITDATSIPYSAFYNCSWIESITVNQAVESIGSYAFYNCSALTSFEIPDNVSVLNSYLFDGCTNLETVNFSDNLTQIGISAFNGCASLFISDLVIPDGVTSIEDNAFSGCQNITSITVPDSVISIGRGAFKGTNPTKVTLPFVGNSRTSKKESGVFGFIFGYTNTSSATGTINQYSDYYYYIPKTIKEVVITDDVRVPENAFRNCSWIEKVYINDIVGDTILVVGNNAFYYCPAMTVYVNRDTAVHTYCERGGIKHCSTKSITLDTDKLELSRNESDTIDSEVILLNGNIDTAPETVWSSSDTSVVTVDKNTGLISAVSPGTAIVTADSEGVTATAEVTVSFKLEGIALNKASTEIDINKTETLTVTYSPDDTTDSRDITWKSSNNTVATVDENGTVTAVKRGKATITATGANGVTATCEVQVLVPITEIKFESEAVSIPRSTRQKVPFTINPADYTDTYTVTSSDTEIATVDKFGNVVARKVGTAVITVKTSRGLEDNCVVTVYSPATSINLSADNKTIFANSSFDLTAELSPSDCTDKVTWYSSDDSIAVVDSDGEVTGVSKGVVTITATADSGVTADCVVTVESDINNTTIYLEYNETDYDGEDKTPEVYVYFDDERLVEETDYLLYYYDNHDAGDAGVIITSLYDGTEITKTFKINPLTVTALEITCKTIMTYTGSELKGVENITYKSLRLAEGVDYDIRYENNVNVGKATATITGKGNFTGPTTRTFNITAKPISETTITLDNNTFRYDGKKKTPTVTVRDGAKTLELGKDYTVEYTDNINAGEATVTVTGIGNYGSYAEKKFNIEKRSISDATVVLSPDKFLDNGDGKANCPQVTVTDGDRELEQDVDYTVAYDNNIEAGIGTVVITAKGNYSSSTSANFEICLTGDINNDGRVDVLDATAVQKFSVDKVEFSDYQKFVADVNHDGVVDILDASQIQKYAVDKISSF